MCDGLRSIGFQCRRQANISSRHPNARRKTTKALVKYSLRQQLTDADRESIMLGAGVRCLNCVLFRSNNLTCTMICCFGKRKYWSVLTGQKIIPKQNLFCVLFCFCQSNKSLCRSANNNKCVETSPLHRRFVQLLCVSSRFLG